jgi:hypothetical protein
MYLRSFDQSEFILGRQGDIHIQYSRQSQSGERTPGGWVNPLVVANRNSSHPSIFSLSSQRPRCCCAGKYEGALGIFEERSSCVPF